MARAARVGAVAADRAAVRIAAQLRDAGVPAEAAGAAVRVQERGLHWRRVIDGALRFAGRGGT